PERAPLHRPAFAGVAWETKKSWLDLSAAVGVGLGADEADVEVVGVARVVADDAVALVDPARVLEPAAQIRAAGAGVLRRFVDARREGVVDEDHLDDAPLDPMG